MLVKEMCLSKKLIFILFLSTVTNYASASIKENIILGDSKGNINEKLSESLSIANADEFINELDDQVDYNVGDNGSNLSGGQKQRVAIARAVYSNSPILILDEATSSLDSKSEKLVQDAIDKLMINKTSIVIAHRLSTIQNANKIIVLDKGEIGEQGNHDELIKNDSYYKKLIALQSFK